MNQVRHPRRGIHDPTSGTPPRRPGSVRRTATTDMLRPDGVTGALHLQGRARDLATRTDGSTGVVDTGRLHAVVDYANGQRLVELEAGAAGAGAVLLGSSSGGGFRRRMKAAFATEAERRTPLHLLLDDVPVCVLISGHVLGAAVQDGAFDEVTLRGGPMIDLLTSRENQCAGFAHDATIMTEVRSLGRAPVVVGPVAPRLDSDDPLGWHEAPALPPTAMRRRRRLDVHRDKGKLLVDAMFRDTYALADGTETVIHEYTTTAVADATTFEIEQASSVPRVLPWVECPLAAASAGGLVGRTLPDLRSEVRSDYFGTSTCTHLNDSLRGLEDVVALAGALPVS